MEVVPNVSNDPHAAQPVLAAERSSATAVGVLILLHGRGATAQSILALYDQLELPRLAALAPQASGNSWYPNSFLAPIESNQPYLDSALGKVHSIVDGLIGTGVPSRQIAIMGFSQGACLTCEYVARYPQRFGAVIALTGGLVGPPGTPRNYAGALDQTPVFLGTSDPDPHVPFMRVQETQSVFEAMGASVELRRYPGLPHTICDDEMNAARELLQKMQGNK